MAYPDQSNFRIAVQRAAWWKNLVTGMVCEAVGLGVIAALQIVLRNALRGGWHGYTATHPARPVVDGNWGPITAEALWTYLGMIGASSKRDVVKRDGQAKTISRESMVLAVWATYYAKRKVDLDIGGTRQLREDPALLGVLNDASIELPADALLPLWLQRPDVPQELTAMGSELPQCRAPTTGGLGQAPDTPELPGKTPQAPPAAPRAPAKKGVPGWVWAAGAAVVAWFATRKKRRR